MRRVLQVAGRELYFLQMLLFTVNFEGLRCENYGQNQKEVQLSQRDRAAGCVIVLAKK